MGNRIIGIGVIVIVIFFNKWFAKGVTRADSYKNRKFGEMEF